MQSAPSSSISQIKARTTKYIFAGKVEREVYARYLIYYKRVQYMLKTLLSSLLLLSYAWGWAWTCMCEHDSRVIHIKTLYIYIPSTESSVVGARDDRNFSSPFDLITNLNVVYSRIYKPADSKSMNELRVPMHACMILERRLRMP